MDRFDEAWALVAVACQCAVTLLASILDITPTQRSAAAGFRI